MQLCLKIGYGYGQNPTLTTTSSPTINSPPSHGGRHNDKEKREDLKVRMKQTNKKLENDNYTLRAGTKILFMSKHDIFLNPQCRKKPMALYWMLNLIGKMKKYPY